MASTTATDMFKEYVGKLKELAKPFIDFRSFLLQRREILKKPLVIFSRVSHRDSWKSPAGFAAQSIALAVSGMTVISLPFIYLCGPSFSIRYEIQHEFGQEWLDRTTKELLRGPEAMPGGSAPTSETSQSATRTDSAPSLEHIKAVLSEELVFVKELYALITPVTLLFASFIFRFLLGKRGKSQATGEDIPPTSALLRSDEVHLTYVVAATFWPTYLGTMALQLFQCTSLFEAPRLVKDLAITAIAVSGIWGFVLLLKSCSRVAVFMQKNDLRVTFSLLLANFVTGWVYSLIATVAQKMWNAWHGLPIDFGSPAPDDFML